MTFTASVLYKEFIKIEVERKFPMQSRGRPRVLSFDTAFDSIMSVLRTGMQWRELHVPNSSYITVFKTMHKWVSEDVFRTAYNRLHKLYRRQRRPRFYCIDSSFVKNVFGQDCLGRNPTDRGRKASKLSIIVDDKGIPCAFHTSPANVSDMTLFRPTIEGMICAHNGEEIHADKGYDSQKNRSFCRSVGLRDRIMKPRCRYGRRTHIKRGVVEHAFAWQDKYRRLILRYDQKISVYLSFTLLAAGNLLGNRIQSDFLRSAHVTSR